MPVWAVLMLAFQTVEAPVDPVKDAMLRRVAEEAEAFFAAARNVISEETLSHRYAKGVSRFRPRIGAAATERPKVRYETKEIISEYAFGFLEDAPGRLHEFRQVTSVNGRKVLGGEKARRTLSINMRGGDVAKKQLLKDFQKHGLTDLATDFGQLLLMFTRRRQRGYQFDLSGKNQIGADPVLVYKYVEISGRDSMTVFQDRKTVYQPMIGELWVRESDYVPLKITATSQRVDGKYVIRSEGSVEYAPTALGVVLPVSIQHRDLVDGNLRTENVARFAQFRRFAAEAEIKFDVVDPPPETQPEKKKK